MMPCMLKKNPWREFSNTEKTLMRVVERPDLLVMITTVTAFL